jgi:hypothetical protein
MGALKTIDFTIGIAIIKYAMVIFKKRLNHKGLSFVEVIMATMVLSIILAGLFAVYRSAGDMTSLALHKLVALSWAHSAFEREKSGFTLLGWAINDPQVTNILIDEKIGTIATAWTNYPGMRKFTATVRWTE